MDPNEREYLAEGEDLDAQVAAASRPLLWGKNTWIVSGVGSPEPPAKPKDPLHEFAAIVRLTPLGSRVETADVWNSDWLLSGDSNFRIGESTTAINLSMEIGRISISVEASLVANSQGRLAAIAVRIPEAQRSVDAYRAARGVFDAIQMQLCFEQDLPIHESAIVAWRADGEVKVARLSLGYPVLDFDATKTFPSAIMQRLITPYANALQSPTAYYSFLVYFALLEFLMGPWIGAIRVAHEKRGLAFPKRTYSLTQPEVGQIVPSMRGKSYQDVLTKYRHLRNLAGGGHFSFSIGPRIGTVVTDDEVTAARDLLRIAVKTLLLYAREDVENLKGPGKVAEPDLAIEIQAHLDKIDGHKKAAKIKNKR